MEINPKWVAEQTDLLRLTSRFLRSGSQPDTSYRRVCSSQPKVHFHRAVEINSRVYFGARLFCSSDCGKDFAETNVAMCLERSHPKLKTHRRCMTIIGLSLLRFWWIVTQCDITKQL